MASYPLTGSTLGSSISTSLSTQILIKVDDVTVGAIQNLTINQTRSSERVREVGTDGVIEIVPNKPTEYDVTVTRVVFDRLRLPESFARGFINIKSQLLPFDIVIIDRTEGDDNLAVVTTLSRCWFQRYQARYTVDNYIITEEGTIWCEDIYTTSGNTSGTAVKGGSRGIPRTTVAREVATDTGTGGVVGVTGAGFRGSLDVSGIHAITKAAFGEDR
jgi:hypothetical protein